MNNSLHGSRRQMIKMVTLLGASALLPNKWSVELLAAVKTPVTGVPGTLRIHLSDFPTLQQNLGSVRIGTSPVFITQPLGLFQPIIITRASDGFHAVSAECTHASCTLPAPDPSNGIITCFCHGSQFKYDGSLVTGPAGFPLRKFAVTVQEDVLSVVVPDIGFGIETEQVRPEPGSRLKLSFLAFENMEYEVAFRSTATAPWQPIKFGVTETGPANQDIFPGQSDYAALYVDPVGRAGFYAVFLHANEV